MKKKLISTAQIARSFGIQAQTVRKAAQRNNIGVKHGNSVMVNDEELAHLVFFLHLSFNEVKDKRTKQDLRSTLFTYCNTAR